MKIIFILLLFIFGLMPPSWAQSITKNDSILIERLLERANAEGISGSLAKGRAFADTALWLSTKKGYARGEGFAYLKIADLYKLQNEYEEVSPWLQKGFQVARQIRDTFMLALAVYQEGQYYLFNQQPAEARKRFDEALQLYFEQHQSIYTANIYNDIGFSESDLHLRDQSTFWYLKALRLQEKLNNHLGAATILNNLSSVYAQIGDSSRAFSFARQAISLREQIGDLRGLNYSYENISRLYWNYNVDSASKYQELSMQLAEQLGITSMKLRSYDNLSVLMDKRRDKQQALQWIQKSIALSREEEDWAGLSSRLRWAAILSGDVKDTIQMAAYFDESLQLINKTNNKAALRDLYASKANAYRKLGDYEKAYVNLQKYHAYRDSLSKEELNANIAKLQLQFDTEKKDIEIERLNTEQRIRQLEIEKQRAIISGNKLEAEQKENEIRLLSQQQDLSDAQIRQQAEELERQLLIAQNNQQQIQMAEQEKALKEKEINSQKIVRNFILAGVALIAILSWVLFNRYQLKRRIIQQQELLLMRNHIARDLHDEMGSTLTSIKILSQVSKSNLQKDKEKSAALLERITEQSTKMQQGISDIVWAINPNNDKLDNMLVKMREFAAETLESKNVETVFAIEEKSLDQSLDMQARRDYFLIYKEAVNNIAKYAQASKVKISIHRKDSELITCLTDDGNGFDATAVRSSNGLVNMKSRALALRGSLTITTEPGKGTSIELRIPTT